MKTSCSFILNKLNNNTIILIKEQRTEIGNIEKPLKCALLIIVSMMWQMAKN